MTELIKMLKIWLACLQPSLGVLGVAMLLFSPLCASAAQKKVGASLENAKQQPSTNNAASVKVEQQLRPTEIAETPDMAIRQLAINTLRLSGVGASGLAIQNPKFKQNSPSPSQISTKRSTSPSTSAVAQSPDSTEATNRTFTPGTFEFKSAPTFSSNSDIDLSSRFSVNSRASSAKTVTADKPTETPVPSASSDPFSLILPQLQQVLGLTPQGDKTAKIQNAPRSNDPLTAVQNGLKELLGQNQAVASKVKTIDPNANSVATLLSPHTSANSGVSLNVSNAKAYAIVPKFDIPSAHQINKFSIRQVSADSTVPLTGGVSFLPSTARGRSNLGGLILGDRASTVYSTSL